MFTVNLGEFLVDVERERGKLIEEHVDIIRKFVFNIFTNTVLATPVDTGNLRANWFININRVTQEKNYYSELSESQASSISLKRLGEFSNYADIPNFWYIYNNLDYASYIEGGHSKVKAPQGMLAISAQIEIEKLKLLER